MSRADPGAATAVDWSRFRKCHVCGVEIGEACINQMAYTVAEGRVTVPNLDRPHGGRKPRTGGT